MTELPDPQMSPPQEAEPLKLYSPRIVRELLERHGLRPTKSLGQNFLIDGNILRLIAESGGAERGVNVLEVGPGLGVLTRELAERGASVTTLEKDERLKDVLQETLAGLDVKIVWGDALDFDYTSLPAGTRVVANLPYYISTALLTRFMRSGKVSSATVLVQREVAERLGAQPGQDGYGYLSALISLHGRAKLLRDVPKGAFFPAPDVTSSVVRLDFTGEQPPEGLVRLLEQALHHRRKTLRNNLRMAGYDQNALDRALSGAGLPEAVRAEDVPLAAMRELHRLLGDSAHTASEQG